MEYTHRLPLLQRFFSAARRFFSTALGPEGYPRMCRIAHRLLLWIISVVILEIGTSTTLRVVGFFDAQPTMTARFPIWIDLVIVALSLLWFLVAEALDLVEYIIHRLARIRTRRARAYDTQQVPPGNRICEDSHPVRPRQGVSD
jgi:hypothetical protein